MKHVLLIDANNLVRRCIHLRAADDLKAGGTFTGGLYLTFSSLASTLRKMELAGLAPCAAYAVYDAGVPAARLAALPGYKAKRKDKKEKMSEEDKRRLYSQMDTSRVMFDALGIPAISLNGYEADDVVAACALHLRDEGGPAPIIHSGDHDLWQMVNYGVRVWTPDAAAPMDAAALGEKCGLDPRYYFLWKTIVGDSSDETPGVKGVGKKTAKNLIEEISPPPDASPLEQWVAVVEAVENEADRTKWMDALIADAERIAGVLEVTDLTNPEVTPSPDDAALLLQTPAHFDRRDLLRFCAQHDFKSIIGDPYRYVSPFERMHARRTPCPSK